MSVGFRILLFRAQGFGWAQESSKQEVFLNDFRAQTRYNLCTWKPLRKRPRRFPVTCNHTDYLYCKIRQFDTSIVWFGCRIWGGMWRFMVQGSG